MKNIANSKIELLKKLQNRTKDIRGNENERLIAEKQLDILMKKYGITEKDLGNIETKRRDFYFKEDWEKRLISQVLYSIKGKDKKLFQTKGKRNWMWSELTDYEYIEFETLYQAYKSAFQKELDIFFLAFTNKNNIFPSNDIIDTNSECTISRSDRMKAAMMMEGIEFTKVRRQLTDGKN